MDNCYVFFLNQEIVTVTSVTETDFSVLDGFYETKIHNYTGIEI